ncbi:YIP1 family protein [Candidatus Roizmanbacteria bacterium]|nr:YIP1 family protein [Candidatus Roizmanbacteria bacterium]
MADDKERLKFDLDFLEKAEGKPASPKPSEEKKPIKAAGEKSGFIDYIKEVFKDFPAFCDKYLRVKNPPYLFFLIWATGVATAIDRVTEFDGSSWLEVWAIVLIGGLIAGYLQYWIGGAIYHLRVKWSKGGDNYDASRNIYIFSGIPIAIASISSLILNTLVYGNEYFKTGGGSSIDILFFFILIAAIAYSINLSYKGVMFIQQPQKNRAIIWFVILPAIFYVLVFSAAIFGEL